MSPAARTNAVSTATTFICFVLDHHQPDHHELK